MMKVNRLDDVVLRAAGIGKTVEFSTRLLGMGVATFRL
jgi:hypothetical protein